MGLRNTALGLLAVLSAVLALLVLLTGVQLVFGDDDGDVPSASSRVATSRTVDERLAAPGGDIEHLRDGDVRFVEVTGIDPDAEVTVRQCTASRSDCDAWIPVRADAAGRAVFLFEFPSRVGTHEVDCGEQPCVLFVRDQQNRTVVAGRLFFGTRASAFDPAVAIPTLDSWFGVARVAEPGAGQVTVGLGVAAAFAGAAVLLFRRGSWRPPEGDPFEGVVLDDPFAGLDLDEWADDAFADRS